MELLWTDDVSPECSFFCANLGRGQKPTLLLFIESTEIEKLINMFCDTILCGNNIWMWQKCIKRYPNTHSGQTHFEVIFLFHLWNALKAINSQYAIRCHLMPFDAIRCPLVFGSEWLSIFYQLSRVYAVELWPIRSQHGLWNDWVIS